MHASPLGFGPADWVALALTVLLAAGARWWGPAVEARWSELAARRGPSMLLLFLLPITMRLLLLPKHPIPTPDIYDEFSQLLAADTFLHGRLANQMHPLHRFFETSFVLQQPTYTSIYPMGQGLLLAFGRAISGSAWTGVVLAASLLCALSYWMLCGYVSEGWALLGGLLAVAEFGPLNLWMNSYQGGTLAAVAGCLVFGALGRPATRRTAVLAGLGFGIHFLTRPFESLFLLLGAGLFCALVTRPTRKWLAAAALAAFPALLLTLAQNKAVTGSWRLLPEQLSQYQYGVPTTLTIQRPAAPHLPLTREQELDYRAQAMMHGKDPDSLGKFLLRLEYRVRYYRFFFLPPLYLALIAFLLARGRHFYAPVLGTLVIFALGTNLFPYLVERYLAAVTCLFLLISTAGLEQISHLKIRGAEVGREMAQVLVALSLAPFLLWYGLHFLETRFAPSELLRFETWDSINHGNPQPRITVSEQLSKLPGKLLVFVHYSPQHIFQEEWVWNEAEIDRARIVWARDLGADENKELIRYYPQRRVLLLEPDLGTPRLYDYESDGR